MHVNKSVKVSTYVHESVIIDNLQKLTSYVLKRYIAFIAIK